jgi:hypothetical protein
MGTSKLFLAVLLFLFVNTSYANQIDSVFIFDDFQDFSQLNDLSKLVIWGENNEYQSCFILSPGIDDNGLSFQAIKVSGDATPFATYVPEVNGLPSLRTMTCFDYEFEEINRSDKIITIEFDAMWNRYDGGYGEQGRIVVTLVGDYPQGGPAAGDIENLALEAPFGRPKYNLRLRNSQPVEVSHSEYVHRSPSFILYGGGLSIDGEFEKSTDWGYWMPGFSSEAGGGPPGQPSASDYPATGTKKSDKPWPWNTINQWHHFTWVLEPELISLYMRSSSEEKADDILVSQMAVPRDDLGIDYIVDKLNEVHNTNITSPPIFYKWFESFNAIRIYYRGFNDNIASLANFKASWQNINDPVFVEQQESESSFDVYPNPNNHGVIMLTLDVKQFNVFDVSGRLITKGTNLKAGNPVNLDFITKGVYIITVIDQYDNLLKRKLIIQ